MEFLNMRRRPLNWTERDLNDAQTLAPIGRDVPWPFMYCVSTPWTKSPKLAESIPGLNQLSASHKASHALPKDRNPRPHPGMLHVPYCISLLQSRVSFVPSCTHCKSIGDVLI